jgi:hypothetical protein
MNLKSRIEKLEVHLPPTPKVPLTGVWLIGMGDACVRAFLPIGATPEIQEANSRAAWEEYNLERTT